MPVPAHLCELASSSGPPSQLFNVCATLKSWEGGPENEAVIMWIIHYKLACDSTREMIHSLHKYVRLNVRFLLEQAGCLWREYQANLTKRWNRTLGKPISWSPNNQPVPSHTQPASSEYPPALHTDPFGLWPWLHLVSFLPLSWVPTSRDGWYWSLYTNFPD